MFETELFHINDVFIASFVLVHNSIFYTTSDMKGNGQIKACRLNENSDVGARERNKIKQTIQQNKPELGFSRQELNI